MTITSENRIAGPFLGNGSTTAFPFSFALFSASHLRVTRKDAEGVYTDLTEGFTVALNANQDTTPGGVVTFLSPPATGESVVFTSNAEYTQLADLQNQGGFFPDTLERALDNIVIQTQQLREELDRAVRVNTGVGGAAIDPFIPVAGEFLTFDAEGRPVTASGTGADAGLRTDLAAPAGSALVGFNRTGGTARSLQSKARDRFDLRDFGVVNRFATSNEYTAEINAALAQAKAEGITAVYCDESYRVAGTLEQPASVGIVSSSGVSRWFEGSPADETAGPGFYKPSDGLDGTLLIRGVGAHLIGVTLDHQKVGGATEALGGVMQMGPLTDAVFNNTLTMNCHFRGHEFNEDTGLRRGSVDFNGEYGSGVGVDCHTIVFPPSTNVNQRYWHQFINPYIENARVGFKLNRQAHGVFVSGFRYRGVYRPVWYKGGPDECIESFIQAVWAQNYYLPTTTLTGAQVAALSLNDRLTALADAAMLTLEDSCGLHKWDGPTESGARLWYVSPASAARYNDASGLINNEPFQAPMPMGWRLPGNEFDAGRRSYGGKREKFIPLNPALADSHVQGHGARIDVDHVQTTGLPLLNGSAGAPTTGAASRIMTKWTLPETVSKSAAPHIRMTSTYTVHASGGGAGSHSTEIEWEYRVADNDPMTGELSIISVRQRPSSGNYVVGCHFISGETGGSRPFAIALTTGNLGAVAPTQVSQSHTGKLESTNATPRPMAEFADIDFTPTALTADDVTDAVSMLATGETAI